MILLDLTSFAEVGVENSLLLFNLSKVHDVLFKPEKDEINNI